MIWGLGLIMHCVVKMIWFTENPIWSIMNKINDGWNDVGIVLGIVACAEILIRNESVRQTTENGKDLSSLLDVNATKQFGSSFLAASGFGSLLFALDNDMWVSENRIRDAIRDLESDVVGKF